MPTELPMIWQEHAGRLAEGLLDAEDRWRAAVAETPRHLLVPHWFWHPTTRDTSTWEAVDGPADGSLWMRAAYSDTTWVTRVGCTHADQASPGVRVTGRPTSSSTLPTLVISMLRHARIEDGVDVLDVGTGSGYSAALLCHRLGDHHVTSVDVDDYLTTVARQRLDDIGVHPHIATVDATGALPGRYDRLVAMMTVRPIPPSWLQALRPGGRLVAVVERLPVIITAQTTPDGGAVGQVTRDNASFMPARHGRDLPPSVSAFTDAVDGDGESITTGRYPVPDIRGSWELAAMYELTEPDVQHAFTIDDGGRRTAWMAHPDGSWARAEACDARPPRVHQSGPRRLWEVYERLLDEWALRGARFPLHDAEVLIDPDGSVQLARGDWHAGIAVGATAQ